ncbi:hypothetical protein [Gemmatimonas groenlandica]|uniref:Copper resistance protein D domain-containing protein n=1 Tax=Gemmatimonas groenlandica TaxID=2732249 RepID=A0A6M4IPS8_9BACT|nr:hypothetical protein [Gemmatimonas groenlandica]QJR36075.1 hypothetical protein HKW67_11445 [Gemmatimonas groenlandica]
MYGILLGAHNLLAWAVLIVGVLVLSRAGSRSATWSEADTGLVRKLTLLVHLQLLAGLGLWFVSPAVAAARASMSTTMKDPALRRLVVEHPTLMVLAVIAATVSSVRVKKAADSATKAKRALVGTLLTLALVAAVIPWQRLITKWTQG